MKVLVIKLWKFFIKISINRYVTMKKYYAIGLVERIGIEGSVLNSKS